LFENQFYRCNRCPICVEILRYLWKSVCRGVSRGRGAESAPQVSVCKFVFIISRSSLNMGHQVILAKYVKLCKHFKGHIFDSIVIKLGQNADLAWRWLMGQGSDLGSSWPSCYFSKQKLLTMKRDFNSECIIEWYCFNMDFRNP
jgi:hypothetical protein